MIQKIRDFILTATLWLFTTSPALAAGNAISEKTATDVQTKLVKVVNDVLMPLGALLIFVTVVISAIKIITSSNKPDERAKAMGSLPYIVGGGLLLGGAMLVAGLIIGQWKSLT